MARTPDSRRRFKHTERHNENGQRTGEPSSYRLQQYVSGTVDKLLDELAQEPKDNRNNKLNDVGLRAARVMMLAPQWNSRDWLEDRLVDACEVNKHRQDDGLTMVENSIKSAFAKADRDGPAPLPKERETPMSTGRIRSGWTRRTGRATGRSAEDILRAGMLTRKQLAELPPPEALIDNVLDQGSVVLLYGDHSTLKTFIALDWACCILTEKAWQGSIIHPRRDEFGLLRPYRVLYVVGEGAHGFSQRLDAWKWRGTTRFPKTAFVSTRKP